MEAISHWSQQNRWLIIGVIVVTLLVLALHSRSTQLPSSNLDVYLSRGEPTVVYFFSNL